VAEGLSSLIHNQINNGNLQELQICKRSPGISHLLFADDSLLFFKAKLDQANVIKKVLHEYESGTGQLLSPTNAL
jgi:hypothetical protein